MGFFDKLFGRKKKEEEKKEENLEIIVQEQENKIEEEKTEEKIEETIIENLNEKKKIEEIKQGEVEVKPETLSSQISQDENKNIEENKEITLEEKPENLEIKEEIKVENEIIEKKPEEKEKKGFFVSLKEKLFRTREGLFQKIKNIFSGRTTIDDDLYEELEELLIQSDIGFDMTVKIVSELEKEINKRGIKNPEEIYGVLKEVMERFLISEGNQLDIIDGELNVILVVGVNGVGKTTTIGKLAKKYKSQGKKVIVGAADTFRAAAIEQLEEWGKRADVEVVKKEQGSDPGSVVFDAIQVAQDKKADILIIDTAGRLHNKSNLMKELEKINNIIQKKLGHNRYESILVIDGTTGQNGLTQAKIFNEVTKLTGFIVTKLDGTAKGGIVFSISEEIKKPIKYIGVGEKIEDLREFNIKDYIDAIFD
ncbi:MAG: signal recognition particle-docking protein FtsY [Fusobacterium perfoetens]|uniref:signal recognition particle-docking protein FtsY n=1 Tax=Fusobacterium perfoetens TaxID=852 RepID=UPI0023F5838D|nr:signal recognition particle-docking protein FtsY [Fusobacterium perfoetens]MCI6152470.1 signal recognition particle-docking protein FtsY [Fusobacterium perfoetens]MDY3238213.1 signal recognition particle-docking protein FtsY [Fusobacterium perfoetens]